MRQVNIEVGSSLIIVTMEDYVQFATALPPNGQLPTLIGIAVILGLGKGGVPGLATVATAATVLTAPPSVPGGLGYAVALRGMGSKNILVWFV